MRTVTVVLHHDAETGWWADSPDVEGYSAADPDLHKLRALVQEGLEFFLETQVEVDERLADGVALPVSLSGHVSPWSSWQSRGSAVAHVTANTSTISSWLTGTPVSA